MRFGLLVKQAVRDFKSKLQLYISFAIFLIVCLSIIVGLLGFFNSYSSIYNNVYSNGYTQNTHIPSFKFLDKNAKQNFNYWQSKYGKQNYLYDNGGHFEDFVMKILEDDKDYSNSTIHYEWDNHKLTSGKNSQISALEDNINAKPKDGYLNLINLIGTNSGYANNSAVQTAYNQIKNKDNSPDPSKLDNYFENKNGKAPDDLYKEIVGNDEDLDVAKLTYYSIIKLNRITNESFSDLSSHPNDNFYNGCLGDKYIVENKLPEYTQFKAGYNVAMDWWPGFSYNGTKDTLRISEMPQEDWMDEAAKNAGDVESKTPHQFKSNDINNIWVKDRLSVSKIPTDVLKNRTYAYVTPTFMHAHNIKLGDKIDASSLIQTQQGFSVGAPQITVIGEALSRDAYFTNKKIGVVFLPIQYLNNNLVPLGEFSQPKDANVSPYYQPGHLFGSIALNDTNAGQDMQKAADDVNNILLSDFTTGSMHQNIFGGSYNVIGPITWSEQKILQSDLFLFRLLCYAISAGVAILDIIVFWFISAESIKLQKKTLWFLKAMGEYKIRITLLPVLGIMVPFLVSAILSIFGSLFVNNIMISAIGNSYGFYLPVWLFGVYSLIVLIIIFAISFFIFILLTYIQLSGSALSIHSDQKVGWIINLYMKTKPMYRKLSTGTQIGISFIVQNLMKNILTLVLLLISFAVVLFSMQFSSSARASAHSYENRNAPYKSLMLNKQNNIDAIQLDTNYIKKDLGASKLTLDTLSKLKSEISLFFGEGYSTASVSNSTNGENQTARDVYSNPDNPSILATAKINKDDELKDAMDNGIIDIYDTLLDPNMDISKHMKPSHAFYNKYLSQEYMRDRILNEKVKPEDISKVLFDNKWVPKFANKFVGKDGDPQDIAILNNLHKKGIISTDTYNYLLAMVSAWNVDAKGSDIAEKDIDDTLTYISQNFDDTINDLRSTYNSAKSALNLKDIPLNVYFNKILIPKDLDSAYITDLMYNGDSISGFGLDNRDSASYNKIVNPLSPITPMSVNDLTSKNNIVQYNYLNDDKQNASLNVHHIDAYVSGNFATEYHISKGDIIDTNSIRIPMIDSDNSIYSMRTYPDVFIRVKDIVEESSIYKEIYFNKIDLFNYLDQYLENDWSKDIEAQRVNNLGPDKKPIITRKDKSKKKSIALKAEISYLQGIIKEINSDSPNAKYVLNNSVFSKENIPYGFSHWTMNTKTAVGYTLLDYIDLPIFDYSSDAYKLNYANNLYVFSLIAEKLMKSVQPIITTLNKFVTILLILTFVVALILIDLVLWENKQTILLFKAMGYKKREIDGYLLVGYIIADCLGLAAGILISYYGIRYASEYAFNMLHVSLFFVWSWQFLVTAIAMAIVFIAMIFIAVNWYTDRQRPRDAFNTL